MNALIGTLFIAGAIAALLAVTLGAFGAHALRELGEELLDSEGGDLYQTDPNGVRRRRIPAGVEVYEINGPFFFGVADRISSDDKGLKEIGVKEAVLMGLAQAMALRQSLSANRQQLEELRSIQTAIGRFIEV